jgi:RND family efflux transporter MFP subunit
MRNTESESAEETLRRENLELKRQLQEIQETHSAVPSKMWRPSNTTIWAIFLGAVVLVTVAFFAGYLPFAKRRAVIAAESLDRQETLPRVEVIEVGRSPQKSELELPGNIEAVTEAPILARADGYLLHRMVDMGDRVKAGQLLAEIEAPELDEQVQQAQANLEQAHAGLDQALANYEQGKSTTDLAKVTADRWSSLSSRGVVSRQENDQYQAAYRTQVAALQSLDKAIAAQRSNIAAAQANLARLQKLQGYRMVKAPFDGVITARNVDTGALVNAASTMLFRIGQTDTLRTYVNVPQLHSSSVRIGQAAHLNVSNLPGRVFTGTVARTANALDPNTRTLLVEVRVPNGDGALLPGMYAQVSFSSTRAEPPLVVPSVALISRGDGPRVAVVTADHTVHLQAIRVGRDYGDRLEVLSGLREGDIIIPNPGDAASEGLKVDPVGPARAR